MLAFIPTTDDILVHADNCEFLWLIIIPYKEATGAAYSFAVKFFHPPPITVAMTSSKKGTLERRMS